VTKQIKERTFYILFSVFSYIVFAVFICVVLALLIMIPLTVEGGPEQFFRQITCWFDPVFYQYNLLLLLLAVLLTPALTLSYVYSMKDEKKRRLSLELPHKVWNDEKEKDKIIAYVNKTFHISHFIGSMSVLSIIVMLGFMVMLLLKPVPLKSLISDSALCGVDYRQGVNFLMLGPYMNLFIDGNEEFLRKLSVTLTAFQYGFLGAYVYYLTHLVRSYFTLDLTPHTFVESSIRMTMGSILSLVCSFFFMGSDQLTTILPAISFFIGFFPSRGLLLLENLLVTSLKSTGALLSQNLYNSLSMSTVPGMSFAHEIRMQREGYDTVENLALADPVDLSIRTGFSYGQLRNWISQAQLIQHLREDYQKFVNATGISSTDDLTAFVKNWEKTHPGEDPCDELAKALNGELVHKIRVLCAIES